MNSELRKHRVTVTAHARDDGRSVDLTRTFELAIRVSYEPSAEPSRLEIRAGESATVAIRANRLPPFNGPDHDPAVGRRGMGAARPVEIAEGSTAGDEIGPPGPSRGSTVCVAGSARLEVRRAVTGKPIEVVVVAPKGGRS